MAKQRFIRRYRVVHLSTHTATFIGIDQEKRKYVMLFNVAI